METPLIEEGGDYEEVKSMKEVKAVFWNETVRLWRIGGPIALTILTNYGINALTSIFVGHLGELQLSAVAISISVIHTFSFGFLYGMGSALETLCRQAFGARKVQMLGVYTQRSWIILFISSLIILPAYIFTAPILKILGQEDEIAQHAGQFTILTIPVLLSLVISFPAQKFLQAQSKVWALAWIGLVSLLIHVPLLWILIYVLGWGTTGAAVAFDITSLGTAVAQVVYMVGWRKEGWHGLSWLAFKEIRAFVRLSITSAVMFCLEIWYLMSIFLITGDMSDSVVAVGSLSMCLNLNGWQAMVFYGVNAAISVRVSNELGLRHPNAAKYSVYVTMLQSFLIGLVCLVAVLITKDYFAVIVTSSKELQVAASKLAFLLAISMVLNGVQPVISGVVVGGLH